MGVFVVDHFYQVDLSVSPDMALVDFISTTLSKQVGDFLLDIPYDILQILFFFRLANLRRLLKVIFKCRCVSVRGCRRRRSSCPASPALKSS